MRRFWRRPAVWVLFSALIGAVLVSRFVSVATGEKADSSRPYACFDGDPAAYVFRDDAATPCAILAEIGREYDSAIRPIFAAKCSMCHGAPVSLPLYAWIPPVSILVEYDIEEGREHLDSRYGYPFRADGTNKKHRRDLGEIAEVTREGTMPPWYYEILHWDSRLTPAEKDVILRWTKSGRERLKNPNPAPE